MKMICGEKGILGTDTPEKLRDTLLFLLGLNFALRGGAEHYNLRNGENSQLKLAKRKILDGNSWNIQRMFQNVILGEFTIGG